MVVRSWSEHTENSKGYGELLTESATKYKMANMQSKSYNYVWYLVIKVKIERIQKKCPGDGDKFVGGDILSPFCFFIYVSVGFL